MPLELVVILDFGSQYTQLIARRVREAGVFSEIVPGTTPVAEIAARKPSALSPMPEGLVNILSKFELLDLLAFLEADGRSDAAPR